MNDVGSFLVGIPRRVAPVPAASFERGYESFRDKADLVAFMESLDCRVPAWTRRAPLLPPDPDEPPR